ncbi:hypothetical protein V2J09_006412 [Rumex salicifolius]
MAYRVLNRFRSVGICNISSRRTIYPRINNASSHCRSFSDAAQPLKEDASPAVKPPVTDSAGVNDNRRKVSFKSSLSQPELRKFSAIADTWWDAEGPFKPLHALNPARLAFIRLTLCDHFGKDPNSIRPFEGLKFIDVGCGGGILSELLVHIFSWKALLFLLEIEGHKQVKHSFANFTEHIQHPLARMGASVTGIDAVEKNIKIASLHAELDPVTSVIEYQCTTAEKLVEEQKQFDAVLSLEVIEHVADPAEFCKSLAELTVPNGATVISTINRSMRAYAGAIIAAEYVLQWLPKGTHEWSKFLTPEELVLILNRASISVKEMAGFVFNPLTGRWSVSDDIGVNFIAYGAKNV